MRQHRGEFHKKVSGLPLDLFSALWRPLHSLWGITMSSTARFLNQGETSLKAWLNPLGVLYK